MRRRPAQAAVVFAVAFAAAQLVRPERVNPATDSRRAIGTQLGTTSELAAILDRSCRDCHSNNTEWRWYSKVAPVSWLMASAVKEGRRAVNFSEWAGYSREQQGDLMLASCEDARDGSMPGVYTSVRPDTRLSARDIDTICAAARQTEAKR